jgi:4-alpha-glucanotransferase
VGERAAGILLHPTSLPGPGGIGELGTAATAFLDFLSETGQRVWQVLPLGPTGYGDSPYQCFSAFAGNPLLVSLHVLLEQGLLRADDLARLPAFPERSVDFGRVIEARVPLLKRAFEAFEAHASGQRHRAFAAFQRRHARWLDDFALFMALKRANGGTAWTAWDRATARREPAALRRARRELGREARAVAFEQWLFFEQWAEVRRQARARGIRILGDIPIFVAHDSADVWAHPELFHLDADGRPMFQAGVPPDYFSATGQLWGNPLYRWNRVARSGYAWWIERFRAVLAMVDLVRLDHFRGFEAYWQVPGAARTAIGGHWVRGPGKPFFAALKRALGALPIVAEDLGVITPEVEALREGLGLPGMAILQFAFGTDPQANGFLPHNYSRHKVVYTGTHDNDTVVGWWRSGVGDSTRTAEEVEEERARALAYCGGDGAEIHWDLIRTLFTSVAETAIVPLQDVLGAGSEARMNLPGRGEGNWRWRYLSSDLTPSIRERLRGITEGSGRCAPRKPRTMRAEVQPSPRSGSRWGARRHHSARPRAGRG